MLFIFFHPFTLFVYYFFFFVYFFHFPFYICMRYRKSDVTCITMCTHETCSTIRNFHTCDMACIGNSLNHIILSVKESGLNYSVKENLVALKFNFIKFKIHKNIINQGKGRSVTRIQDIKKSKRTNSCSREFE